MRVLRSFGMKDKRNDPTMIDWDAFRAFSPLLEKKSDEEMQEHLYCILAMCTKVSAALSFHMVHSGRILHRRGRKREGGIALGYASSSYEICHRSSERRTGRVGLSNAHVHYICLFVCLFSCTRGCTTAPTKSSNKRNNRKTQQ